MLHPPARDIVVVHSSDLHVDHDYTARLHGGDGTAGLGCVLDAARDLSADVVLLAGDTFDSHRVPQNLIEQAAALIGAAALPVVILPGNHDPAIATAVYRDGPLKAVKNLHVIGVTHDETVAFPDLALEVWGRPHRDYDDMIPFATVRARRSRWLIAMAHGHWNRAVRVGNGVVPAYYSGSPEYAGTVNVVRLSDTGGVTVTRAPLVIAREAVD
jgi:DNA repair exonuclease SbcCD nuclease subunit